MSEPKSYSFPFKVAGGVAVTVNFKNWSDAFNWLRAQGQLGENSVKEAVNSWEEDAHKEITREARGLRKRLGKWLSNFGRA